MGDFRKRLIQMTIVVLAVTAITFAMVNLLPGDAAEALAGPQASREDVLAIRRSLGLDAPLAVRYVTWLGQVVRGDLGVSYHSREPVMAVMAARIPVTVELMILVQVAALLLAVPSGIITAYRPNTFLDRFVTSLAFAFMSTPIFVMALVLIFIFALTLPWLPATGYLPFSESPLGNLRSMVLPTLSIALVEWVPLMRVLRSDMIATLQEDYILVARANGLPVGRILFRHALRPSSFSLVTILGLHIGHLLGGALIVELIFALPGIGRLLIDAIFNRDLYVVQGCILFISVAYVAVNGVVDVAYAVLDPRVRTQGEP